VNNAAFGIAWANLEGQHAPESELGKRYRRAGPNTYDCKTGQTSSVHGTAAPRHLAMRSFWLSRSQTSRHVRLAEHSTLPLGSVAITLVI